MKIAIVGPINPLRGNVAQYTTLLIRVLSIRNLVLPVYFERQYQIFLFPGKSNHDFWLPPFCDMNAKYILDSVDHRTRQPSVRRIRSFRPHMVIFQWWVTFWVPPQFQYLSNALRKYEGVPEIKFVYNNFREHEANRIKELFTKRVFSRIDRSVAHCERETERLREILPKARVSTIHPTYRNYCANVLTKDHIKPRLRLGRGVLRFLVFCKNTKG